MSRRPLAYRPDPLDPARQQIPDVVVWEADGEPLAEAGYGRNIALRLGRLGCDVAVVDYRNRALTPTERAAPVHVLSGGETSAFSADPATCHALDELGELVDRAGRDEVTLIGICLGAQLLARVLAPDLPPSTPAGGMEAGWCTVSGLRGPVEVAELHYEQIHPHLAHRDGITVTHRNGHSPIQGFGWQGSVIGMQFHPEWSPADARSVLERHQPVLGAHHDDPLAAWATVNRGQVSPRWRPIVFNRLVAAPAIQRLRAASRVAA